MTDKEEENTKLSNEELADKLFKTINQELMSGRVTASEHYDLQIKLLIWKQLQRIANALEENKK